MVQLLIKDLRVTKKFILLGFVFIGFIFFALGAFEGVPLAMPAAIFAHFLMVTATKMDEKNNNGILLASFPLKRNDLVTAKYLSLFMFIGVSFLLTALWRLVAPTVLPADEWPGLDLPSSVIALMALSVFYSIYLPLMFGLGSRVAQVLDLIVLFTIGALGLVILRILEWTHVRMEVITDNLAAISGVSLGLECIGGSLLLLGVSWIISVYLYERKDF